MVKVKIHFIDGTSKEFEMKENTYKYLLGSLTSEEYQAFEAYDGKSKCILIKSSIKYIEEA